MKARLLVFAAIFCLAASSMLAASESTQLEKISSQTAQLQAQLAELQQEVKALKQQLHTKHKQHISQPSSARTAKDAAFQARMDRQKLQKFAEEEKIYLPFDLDVPGQAFVSTGPYVGVPIQYAGSNLIVNSPSVNTDVQLLVIRKNILQQLEAMHGEITQEPYHSHLLLSGLVSAQASYANNSGAVNRNVPVSGIDVTNVALDAFFIGPSEWSLGFVEFSYNNGPPAGSSFTVSNSSVFINKAFITIGDLLKSPFYGSAGQFYVPFGAYSSVLISAPLTQSLARTKARSLLLGIQQQAKNALYAAIYIFRGDSGTSTESRIHNGGINLGYKIKRWGLSADIGGGYIANLADSTGLQAGNEFQHAETLIHRVAAYNIRGLFNINEKINLIAEYVGASTAFNQNDMSFNGHGAKPWAIDTEAFYSFYIFDKPSALGIGYAKTNQALSLGLPLIRYSLLFSTSIWRNTLQSIEFRHDKNYAATDTANGPVAAITPTGPCSSINCTSTGEADNAITAQFDYYF
jgi:cell division protein FtsB